MRLFIPLACLGLLAGCASTTASNYTQTINTWRGANVKSLTARWGSPSDQATGPNGSTAYFYNTTSYAALPSSNTPAIGVHYSPNHGPVITNTGTAVMNNDRGALNLNCTAVFIANAKGIITNTEVRGMGCYGGTDFASRMGNPNHPATGGSQ